MYSEFGLRLPGPTLLLVTLGGPLHSHPIESLAVVVLLIVSVFFVVRLWNRFAITTRYFGRVTAGNSANVSAMSSLTRQLAELLSINVSLPDALWIAGHNSGHHFFQGVTAELARDAHRGQLAESPVARTMPANLIHALQAGPDGQPSVPLLRELATIYSDRVADRVDWSSGAIAQLALVLVGIVVAFFVIALFMPMVSLISGLS
jgi:type IV pilus assembly protein PilC